MDKVKWKKICDLKTDDKNGGIDDNEVYICTDNYESNLYYLAYGSRIRNWIMNTRYGINSGMIDDLCVKLSDVLQFVENTDNK